MSSLDMEDQAERDVPGGLRAALEYGPIVAYLVVYLIYRHETYLIGGAEYSGFVAITAGFVPVFLLATVLLWRLTGRLARLQAATSVMLVLFGGLGAVLNDPAMIKMKPTAIYLMLAALLGAGLLRGQSWLKYIMEDMIPLKNKGWMILTRRLTVLFVLAAAANELVWRTQSEAFWVLFETIVMPLIVAGVFLSQIRLFAAYASWGNSKKAR